DRAAERDRAATSPGRRVLPPRSPAAHRERPARGARRRAGRWYHDVDDSRRERTAARRDPPAEICRIRWLDAGLYASGVSREWHAVRPRAGMADGMATCQC